MDYKKKTLRELLPKVNYGNPTNPKKGVQSYSIVSPENNALSG
jgi:hypothetical protein